MRIVSYIMAAAVFSLALSCKEKEHWVSPLIAPITEAVFASGHIEPVDQFVLTSLSEAYLANIHVSENDVVKKGDMLFELDNRSGVIEEDAARKNLTLAQRNASLMSPSRQKLLSDIENAKQKQAQDSLQLIRMNRLYQTGSVAKMDMENAQLAYDHDVNTVASLQENLKATDIALQQNLIQAESQYRSSSVHNEYYSLRSPGLFKIYEINKKRGELVKKGEKLALLGDPERLQIVLEVDEASIGKVRPGQQVLVELNTDKSTSHKARITRIYPYFDHDSQSFKVEASFEDVADVIAGTLLQANIIVAKKEKALLIPKASLSPDGNVIVRRDDRRDTLKIKTGIISTEWVEVLDGIGKQDEVLKAF